MTKQDWLNFKEKIEILKEQATASGEVQVLDYILYQVIPEEIEYHEENEEKLS